MFLQYTAALFIESQGLLRDALEIIDSDVLSPLFRSFKSLISLLKLCLFGLLIRADDSTCLTIRVDEVAHVEFPDHFVFLFEFVEVYLMSLLELITFDLGGIC